MNTITYSASASVPLSPSRTCGAGRSGGVPAKERGVVAGDLAWPVRGLIPALALELLSSATAQIFRFGLGCHVGSEILCSRLLPLLFRAGEEPWDGVKKGD